MIDTVLFDMGGTLEDLFSDEAREILATEGVLRILREKGFAVNDDVATARRKLLSAWDRYYEYRKPIMRELKPEEIWGNFLLKEFGISYEEILPYAEELAHMWEVTHFTRTLRPHVKELLEGLQGLGMKLGVVSNTASLYQVYEVLKDYGIRDYFQNVTLSSVTGYRKPHPNIFRIALCEMQADPTRCAFVGDTLSRDVIGPRSAGITTTFQIQSFLTQSRDVDVPKEIQPTYKVEDIYQVYEI
ncbi:MAG: HAD family hydrolase, partial [Oscillibacter sp.]